MFCRKCGLKLEDGDVFCPSCGNKVVPLPKADTVSAAATSDFVKSDQKQGKGAYIGVLFDDREPSYSNAVQKNQEEVPETAQIQQEPKEDVALPEFIITEEPKQDQMPEKPPMPDLSALKAPLFSGNDDLIPSEPIIQAAPEVDSSDEAVIANEQEPQVAASDNASEPYVMPDIENLAGDGVQVSTDSSDAESGFVNEDEKTVMATTSEEDGTVVSPIDDSYNIYSGALPGVDSQNYRYPTNDNAYPNLSSDVAPQFDDMVKQFGEYQPEDVDFVQPVQDFQMSGGQGYSVDPLQNSDNYGGIIQQNTNGDPPKEPKRKNAAMWIIIACISIIIISIGAVCTVILTQYGSFGDFFASFSDSDDKDEDNDEDDNKKKTEKETKTEIRTTELKTEFTTIEITTLPPTTEKTFDGNCGPQVYYDYDEASKVLSIIGFGEMQNYANVVTPWAGKDVKIVEVGEGITNITPGAFTEIIPDSIHLSSTVSSFDVLAVNKFGGIEVSPSNKYYKSVDSVLFDKSGSKLIAYPNQKTNTSYTIPEGVKIIGELAFYEATNLSSLSLGSTVEYVDNYAFKGCVNIQNFEVPLNVAEIRSGVFYGWTELQEIYVANSGTKVVEDWNDGCNANVTVAS